MEAKIIKSWTESGSLNVVARVKEELCPKDGDAPSVDWVDYHVQVPSSELEGRSSVEKSTIVSSAIASVRAIERAELESVPGPLSIQ